MPSAEVDPGHRRPPRTELLGAADAEARSRRMAGAMAAAGLVAGDRIAFCLGSSAMLISAVLGATRTGIIPVMVNPTLLAAERDLLIADTRPGLVVDDMARLTRLDEGSPVDLAPVPLTRPMHFTSGTTGRPKGVISGPWDEATARAAFEDEADLWAMTPDDIHLVCSPMYHTVSVRFAATTLLRGGSCVILERFDAATALDVLRSGRLTNGFLVPTHLRRLLALPQLGRDETFGSLRFLAHAGEPCPPALKRSVIERVRPGALWEFYGSTEGQFTRCSTEEWLERPGTVGRARPGRRLLIDAGVGADPVRPEGPDGPVGTIWCEAPPYARFSYWENEEATAEAWRGDAFTVGDVGHLDRDGYLYLSGRRHDLIISGGVNVYPAEIEAALSEVPGVAEAAVFGRPDDRWGQRVCAAVILEPRVGMDDVRRAAEARLAPYKRPKEYVPVRDLPHTATGKLLRRALVEHLGLVE